MLGPYLPTRPSNKSLHPQAKINVRPTHPQFGMFLHHNMLLDRVKVSITVASSMLYGEVSGARYQSRLADLMTVTTDALVQRSMGFKACVTLFAI